jgi:hypothetical protein
VVKKLSPNDAHISTTANLTRKQFYLAVAHAISLYHAEIISANKRVMLANAKIATKSSW